MNYPPQKHNRKDTQMKKSHKRRASPAASRYAAEND
jgi:hypothetical protein